MNYFLIKQLSKCLRGRHSSVYFQFFDFIDTQILGGAGAAKATTERQQYILGVRTIDLTYGRASSQMMVSLWRTEAGTDNVTPRQISRFFACQDPMRKQLFQLTLSDLNPRAYVTRPKSSMGSHKYVVIRP